MRIRIQSQWSQINKPNKYIELIEVSYNQVKDLFEKERARIVIVLFGIVLIIDFK